MIYLDPHNTLTRYFVWCCDYLPLTTGSDHSINAAGVPRLGSYYTQNGTTLCHIFWAILWMPLILTTGAGFGIFLLIRAHIGTYNEYHYELGVIAYFIPEIIVMALCLFIGLTILCILGASKSNFFQLLWTYIKCIKRRVCPLVTFNPNKDDQTV